MKNLINWFLKKDGHLDWLKHDILGTIAYLLILFLMILKQDNLELSIIVAFFIGAVGAGAGREIYQKIKGKEPSAWDILWTIKTPFVIAVTMWIMINVM